MKPQVGETGKYYSSDCSLVVEIVSYEESKETINIGLKILRNLDRESAKEYREGDIITYSKKIGSDDDLEGLILDSGLRIWTNRLKN